MKLPVVWLCPPTTSTLPEGRTTAPAANRPVCIRLAAFQPAGSAETEGSAEPIKAKASAAKMRGACRRRTTPQGAGPPAFDHTNLALVLFIVSLLGVR